MLRLKRRCLRWSCVAPRPPIICRDAALPASACLRSSAAPPRQPTDSSEGASGSSRNPLRGHGATKSGRRYEVARRAGCMRCRASQRAYHCTTNRASSLRALQQLASHVDQHGAAEAQEAVLSAPHKGALSAASSCGHSCQLPAALRSRFAAAGTRTSLPRLSERIESQRRRMSGSANSCVSSSVIHRKAKNWYDTCRVIEGRREVNMVG